MEEKNKIVLDLSKWNIVDDYSKMMDAIDGVILRIGYRSLKEGIITEDQKFKTHLDGLKKIKAAIGVYFFTTAVNEAEAREEAEWVVDRIKKDNITLSFPIAVDTEHSNNSKTGRSDKLDKYTRTSCVIAFCERIKELGYRPMIYAADDWFVSQLDYNRVRGYLKWIARYSLKAPEKAKDNVVGWQKTDDFSCKGVKKGLDMSEWYAPIKPQFSKLSALEAKAVEAAKSEKISTGEVDHPLSVGAEIVLKDEPLYKTSSVDTVSKKISGTYYYWDDQIKSGKIRITNKKENVGVMGKVTGWITAS